jgi:hypothetical protein
MKPSKFQVMAGSFLALKLIIDVEIAPSRTIVVVSKPRGFGVN